MEDFECDRSRDWALPPTSALLSSKWIFLRPPIRFYLFLCMKYLYQGLGVSISILVATRSLAILWLISFGSIFSCINWEKLCLLFFFGSGFTVVNDLRLIFRCNEAWLISFYLAFSAFSLSIFAFQDCNLFGSLLSFVGVNRLSWIPLYASPIFSILSEGNPATARFW